MDKCWEIINGDNGEEYGIWLNRADAEEMVLAITEEVSYECFCWHWLRWEDSYQDCIDWSLVALWRIFIKEHNLFK